MCMAANAAFVTVQQLHIQVSFEKDSIAKDSNNSIATVPNIHRLGKWIVFCIVDAREQKYVLEAFCIGTFTEQ